MKFFLVQSILLVLAVTVCQSQAEDAIPEGTVVEGAVAEGAVAEGAVGEGAVAESAIAEEAKSKIDVVEVAVVDGAVAEEPKAEVDVVDGAVSDGATAKSAALVEDGVGEIVTIDCVYQKPDCFCPQHEEPVCSVNGCTYGNDCKRICADAEFAYEGACHEDDLVVVE